MKRPLFFFLLLTLAVAALAGWSFAQTFSPAPTSDLKRLSSMADDVMSAGERTLVITIRGKGDKNAVYAMIGDEYGKGSVSCAESGGECDFVLRYTADGADALAETVSWMERASAALKRNKLSGSWNINVQGWLREEAKVDSVWEQAERSAQAAPVESYEDAGTRSVSYRSPMFSASVESGGKRIGLQAAAHHDTGAGKWRVTLGTPVILIEY